ncbi:DUF4238 domain-containing protein [Flavobacterium sp. KACC 22761]|uniref:DUF4238 domain-containing protein n=1 Tax=Flavobacterium sp. KACC 22761 TaxID=3092665 RepID=UPI002A756F11|nr:DUF4238 domain-containing protein [Flavobacterium sp. KACC 22761]WPO77493.1 DUF4238 domain-containing protein [Flavobacterium sp. KACC 22761]
MNNISSKHHYLPVFYLKGFTKESGKFKIYNVQKKCFVQKGKEFSPGSYFYEKNANTVFTPQGKSDFIEKSYSDLEGKISKIIKKIDLADSDTKFGVNEDDMPMLNTFVSLIYWRLPKNKKELEIIIESTPANQLGFNVHNADNSVNQIASEELKNDLQFIKSYKFLTSLFDSVRGLNCRTPYTIIPKHENLPFICSDNPIIFEKDEFPNVYEDDYIIPLSGKRFFVKTEIGKMDPYLWMLIDIVIYKQAIQYVSCTHEEYLRMLDDNFEKYNISLTELKQIIFKKLRLNFPR